MNWPVEYKGSDNACGAKFRNCGIVIAQFGQNRIRMLAQIRDWIHPWFWPNAAWGQQCGQRTGGGIHLTPPIARSQLRVGP